MLQFEKNNNMQYANDHSCGTSAFFMNMSMAWHVLVWRSAILVKRSSTTTRNLPAAVGQIWI